MKKKPLIAIIAAMLIWGTTFAVSKNSINTIEPGFLVFIRSLIGSGFLLIFCLRKFKTFGRKNYLLAILTGLFVGAGYLTQTIGLKYTNSANSAFLENVYIIIVPLLTWIITKKYPGSMSFFCSLIAIGGVLLIFVSGGGLVGGDNLIGLVLSIFAGICFGLNIAFTGNISKDKDPFIYTFIQFSCVALMALIYTIFFEKNDFDFDFGNIISLIYLGVFCTGLAWILRNYAQNSLSPITVSIVLPFTSVVSMIVSIITGEINVTVPFVVGGLLIITAAVLDAITSNVKSVDIEK